MSHNRYLNSHHKLLRDLKPRILVHHSKSIDCHLFYLIFLNLWTKKSFKEAMCIGKQNKPTNLKAEGTHLW